MEGSRHPEHPVYVRGHGLVYQSSIGADYLVNELLIPFRTRGPLARSKEQVDPASPAKPLMVRYPVLHLQAETCPPDVVGHFGPHLRICGLEPLVPNLGVISPVTGEIQV